MLGIEWNVKIGYEAKAMFSGAVYFRDALCNDTPRRKEKSEINILPIVNSHLICYNEKREV